MSAKAKKSTIVLHENKENAGASEELKDVFNAIKDEQIKNGNVLPSTPVNVIDFTGKVLKRDKSVLLNGGQYTVKKGTDWKDMSAFHKKQIKFSSVDFE